jgi:hypothetical protein
LPSTVTGSKGLPLANSTLPLVQVKASSAVHSALDVGLDSGKMMGRSLSLLISSTTSLLNILATVLTPMIAVGFSFLTQSAKSRTSSCSCAYGILWCCN